MIESQLVHIHEHDLDLHTDNSLIISLICSREHAFISLVVKQIILQISVSAKPVILLHSSPISHILALPFFLVYTHNHPDSSLLAYTIWSCQFLTYTYIVYRTS